MDAGYDALEQAAASYTKSRDHGDDEGRSHRSHQERDHDREREPREHRHRERDDREDRYRERDHHDRDRDGGRDRDRERERERGYDRDRERGYERDEDRSRRRRREDDDLGAEPMGGSGGGGGGWGHRDRRPRYDEEPFAAPMRGYDAPPRRDEGGWRGGGGGGGDRGDRGRGGGGGGGGDWGGRGGGDQRGRRGGVSPSRSPTPPGTRPLEERHLDKSLWDIRPGPFEGIGAMEAKMTGMFTYGPGRVPPPAHLGIPGSLIAGSFPPGNIVNPMRQSKRLYIGGVNDTMTEDAILKFFNKQMQENKLAAEMKGDSVVLAQLNIEKGYAFIEFRTADEATAAMQLDGALWEGTPLRIRRPKDYIGIDPSLGMLPGMVGTTVADSPNKLFIGGLPTYLNDEQVMELLKSFGELKSFNLVKEGTAQGGVSKGFAFCEYTDTKVTDMAIQGLHGFQLGDRTLVVQRAEVGRNTGIPGAYTGGLVAQAILQSANATDAPSSRVMLLLNMVTPEELYDDAEYEDILADINDECGKYGEIEGVRVPRPVPKSKKWESTEGTALTAEKNRKIDAENGVGRVYVMYKDIDSATKAMKALGGRQFAGRTILVANVPEEEFLGPAPPPPPPEDIEAAAEDALKDIMAGLT
ncbi:hypothetical protein EHS25_000212 [Saitozyma podzolica]|uniref:RRM domain-containing protein n=1 Tax=Saitozyma podzolica TaxID=1890683 RepID=A0A427YVR4_9TREE|nr:hypothetical protein EHS25_000212 [Saitozyma podzolica]